MCELHWRLGCLARHRLLEMTLARSPTRPPGGQTTNNEQSRAEADVTDGPSVMVSPLLTADDVSNISKNINAQRDVLVSMFGTEKDGSRKEKIRTAINEVCSAFSVLSNGYMYLLGAQESVTKLKSTINDACADIKQAAAAPTPLAGSTMKPFASIVSAGKPGPTHKVSLATGRTFSIKPTERVIIGPRDAEESRITSSQMTKSILQKTVSPTDIGARIERVSFCGSNSVLIEGGDLKSDALTNNAKLLAAGLEVKPDKKRKPRLIVHDIPVELESEQITNSIIEQNLSGAGCGDLDVVYLYPAGKKKFRSCVIEVSPAIRETILGRGKMCIDWRMCRVDDHVSVLQCFNCSGFGHVQSACSNKTCCRRCAGEHLSRDCRAGNNYKCVNCLASGQASVGHSASDEAKCPILRRRIERKISSIDYGKY